MQWNKRIGGIFIALGVLIGAGAAAALSVRAQDSVASHAASSAVPSVVETGAQNVSSPANTPDTDTIQDPGGKEQPDAVITETGKQDAETNDDHADLKKDDATEKQAKMDARKQAMAQEVASGKMTQAQMDQKLQAMAVREGQEKNEASDPKDASEGVEKNGANDTNEPAG